MQTLSIHSPSACSRKTNFQSHKPLPNKNNKTRNTSIANNTVVVNNIVNSLPKAEISKATAFINKNTTPKVNKIIPTNNNNNKTIINNNNNLSVAANTSFVRTSMVTKACRKPFVPPKQSQCLDASSTAFSDMTLDLSAIQGSSIHNVPSASVPFNDEKQQSSTRSHFSSTQKCSMEEIEQKRKFAQTKLRERLRRKKK